MKRVFMLLMALILLATSFAYGEAYPDDLIIYTENAFEPFMSALTPEEIFEWPADMLSPIALLAATLTAGKDPTFVWDYKTYPVAAFGYTPGLSGMYVFVRNANTDRFRIGFISVEKGSYSGYGDDEQYTLTSEELDNFLEETCPDYKRKINKRGIEYAQEMLEYGLANQGN